MPTTVKTKNKTKWESKVSSGSWRFAEFKSQVSPKKGAHRQRK